MENYTPEYVLGLTKPTESFLCPVSSNIFEIRFGRFKIRNMDNNEIIVDVSPPAGEFTPLITEDKKRLIKYQLPREFLKLKTIGTTVEFKVGPKELKNFRMIERHYFGDKLLRSFDFPFGFCIPNSVNTLESIYTVPKLTEQEIDDMVKNPWKTKSDSFYFNENILFMHHKAEYMYVDNLI